LLPARARIVLPAVQESTALKQGQQRKLHVNSAQRENGVTARELFRKHSALNAASALKLKGLVPHQCKLALAFPAGISTLMRQSAPYAETKGLYVQGVLWETAQGFTRCLTP